MAISVDYQATKKTLVIMILGPFDSESAADFQAAYQTYTQPVAHYEIDAKNMTYLDSSIVSAIIDFCQHVEKNAADACISNMNDVILEEFRVMNLHKFFKPEFCRHNCRVEWVFHSGDDHHGLF